MALQYDPKTGQWVDMADVEQGVGNFLDRFQESIDANPYAPTSEVRKDDPYGGDKSLALDPFDPTATDLTEPVVPEFDILDPEQQARLAGISNEVVSDLERRIDPSFSVVTPEQTDVLGRNIGSVLARANTDALHTAASRGISPGSGVTQQQKNYAASQAANALGNMTAQVGGINEQARQWALGQLERARQARMNEAITLGGYGAGLQSGFGGMVGPAVLGGPSQFFTDPLDLFTSVDEQRRQDRESNAALQAGQPNVLDYLRTIIGMMKAFGGTDLFSKLFSF